MTQCSPARLGPAEPVVPTLRVLGSLTLHAAGQEVPLDRSVRARRVLAALAVGRGELVTADRLADIAWGAVLPADPRAAIHNLISRLRALLRGAPGVELCTRPPGYLLDAPRSAVDSTLFEDRLRAARAAADPQRSLAQLDAALELWRGPAYAEFADEEFARAEASRLTLLRGAAQEDRVDRLLALGRNDQAIALLDQAIAADPLRERPRLQLMTALYRAGRIGAALASYRAYRTLVRAELGVEPGREIDELERRVLRRDVTLQLSTRWTSTPAADQLRAQPARTAGPAGPAAAAGGPAGLVGREADLAATARLLAGRQLLTLVGPGGVGKTALAKRLGRLLADDYPDGVIVCELSALRDEAEVIDLIATQAGVLADRGADPAGQLAAALANRRALLILDNCEHVLPSVTEVAATLLGSPTLRILATSREPLTLPTEQVWRVEPLPVPAGAELDGPAVRLFVDRARSVDPAFEPTPAAGELCRRLDGLPLAIELAAARVNSVTVEELLRRLDEQPQIIDSTRQAIQPRHRSLRGVLDWSYDLLTDDQRAVFDQLAVFPDDFSLDAAAGVLSTRLAPAQVPATVLDLVDRSLVKHVKRGTASRYRLLDTLRRYARVHLAAQGALAAAQARHAGWHLARAEELGGTLGAGRPDWIHLLDAELANLRAVHEHLTATADLAGLVRMTEALHHYALWSLNPEVFDWAKAAVAATTRAAAAAPGPAAPSTPAVEPGWTDRRVAVASATLANGCWLAGDLAGSREHAATAIRLAGGDPVRRYGQLSMATALASLTAEFDVRAQLYQQAELAAAEAGAEPHRLHAQILRAGCLLKLGQPGEAHRLARQALQAARQLGSPDLEARASLCLADIALADDPEQALCGYWHVAELNAGTGNRYGEYQALVSAAFGELLYGAKGCAAAVFGSVLRRWTGLMRDTALGCLLPGVVILLAETAQPTEAGTLSGAIPANAPMVMFTLDENVPRRFGATMDQLTRTLGAGQLAALRQQGAGLDRAETVRRTLVALGHPVRPDPA
jgi:predicted ATPase/DNA-binding SARP family transcriptional activator